MSLYNSPSGDDPYYNWLTQSRLDTFADVAGTLGSSDTTAAQSSLLFTVGRGPQRQNQSNQRRSVGPGFGKGRLGTNGKSDSTDSTDGIGESIFILAVFIAFNKLLQD